MNNEIYIREKSDEKDNVKQKQKKKRKKHGKRLATFNTSIEQNHYYISNSISSSPMKSNSRRP